MLYQNKGIYSHSYGFNWRALITLLIVIPINLPGLVHAIDGNVDVGDYSYFCKSIELHYTNRKIIVPPWSILIPQYPYRLLNQSFIMRQLIFSADKASWLTATFIATVVYLILSLIWPPVNNLHSVGGSGRDDEIMDASAETQADRESRSGDEKHRSQVLRVLQN